MFSTSASHALCRVSQIASPAGRHVLFDVTQIYRSVLCEMDTRALKNPYHDYDGNPALTRELFDSHGRVRKDGDTDGAPWTRNCAPTCVCPASFSSHRSFRSGCAAKSTNFFQWWRMGWSLQTPEIAPATPAGQVRPPIATGVLRMPVFPEYIPAAALNCFSSRRDMTCVSYACIL